MLDRKAPRPGPRYAGTGARCLAAPQLLSLPGTYPLKHLGKRPARGREIVSTSVSGFVLPGWRKLILVFSTFCNVPGNRFQGTIPAIPRMDNLPAHSMKLWTALRVRRLTTLEADALRLPNSRLKKGPINSPIYGRCQREGERELGKHRPSLEKTPGCMLTQLMPSVGRSVAWA